MLDSGITKEYLEVESQIKILEKRKEEIRVKIMEALKLTGLKTVGNDDIIATYIEPVTKRILDSQTLKKENPEIYDQFSKEIVTKESIQVTKVGAPGAPGIEE